MLTIRMQRTGRKGHAMFRVVVQESRLTPTSGKVVALLGSYDPHAKTAVLDKAKAETFLKNGAQPSERAASLLKHEGVALPKWVVVRSGKGGKLRNPEKLRKNQPKEEAPIEEPVAEKAPEPDEKAPVVEGETKKEA
ncbi:MAG TPA: 30S ribosomal protein S16 [Patescibacteria group bacterium]|nr:30S ribosomal protein S16 [Patescibacteria group bacterium]